MATLQELEAALVKADAAGATEDARAFAAEIRRMRDFKEIVSATPKTRPEMYTPSGERDTDTTTAERTLGNPFMRFATGAAAPFLGAMQLQAHTNPILYALKQAGGPDIAGAIDETLRTGKEMKDKGRRVAHGSEGFDWYQAGGQVASPVNAAIPRVMGATPMLSFGGAAKGAALGSGMAATMPVTNGQDFVPEKLEQGGMGAVTGGLVTPIMGGVGAVGRGVYQGLVQPRTEAGRKAIMGRTLTDAAGPQTQQIIADLRSPQIHVPGSAPTAGEAAAGTGSATFAGLQKHASTVAPNEYEAIRQAQNAARLAAVRGVGQDEQALNAAKALRAANAQQNYGAVNADVVGPIPAGLAQRPSIKDGLVAAARSAMEKGKPVPGANQPMAVENMQRVKQALDDAVRDPAAFGIKATEAAEIKATRDAFVQWLEGQSPGWAKARDIYKADSLPINQMQVGQYLEQKLAPALSDYGMEAPQRAGVFAQALRDAPGTLKRASDGAVIADDLRKVLRPDQLDSLQGVAKDLARNADYERLAKAGARVSEGVSNLGSRQMERSLGVSTIPNMLQRETMLANALLRRLNRSANERLERDIALLMRDPQATASVMEKAVTNAGKNDRLRALAQALQSQSGMQTGAEIGR